MRLDQIVAGVAGAEVPAGAGAVEVTAVVLDSRAVQPGSLFCCVPGERSDGHAFAAAAAAAGATALLVEHAVEAPAPQVVVPSVRAAMPLAAANLYGHPSDRLRVAGVTGTNGKTTTTHLLQAVLERHGWRTGIIGTLSGARTTPEAPELQARLAEFRDLGYEAVTMEVSSHALVQHRADAIRFSVAAFTNLSQDHLDYHHTMDAYFAAKCRLFEPDRAVAVWAAAELKVLRNLLRKASMGSTGALRSGISPFCQCQEDICLSTEGARVTIETGTS